MRAAGSLLLAVGKNRQIQEPRENSQEPGADSQERPSNNYLSGSPAGTLIVNPLRSRLTLMRLSGFTPSGSA
jgi:hypothetical protein